ncbi:MAG: cell envelope biogenesis protein OmpA [Syntrophaceae bacterium]|nr:cell envelope biogenesis protein OmpA [Syntrophaceae bacterium]
MAAAFLGLLLALGGCAGRQGPVLYPNPHLQTVGEAQAQRDIEECESMADAYIRTNPGADTAKSTAAGGAAGAVVGGAAGAVTGSLGRGIGVGAAVGAASGLVRGVAKASRPSPLYKRFVDKCLRDRGYEPLGWE